MGIYIWNESNIPSMAHLFAVRYCNFHSRTPDACITKPQFSWKNGVLLYINCLYKDSWLSSSCNIQLFASSRHSLVLSRLKNIRGLSKFANPGKEDTNTSPINKRIFKQICEFSSNSSKALRIHYWLLWNFKDVWNPCVPKNQKAYLSFRISNLVEK